jgi:hypothetical protein
MINNKYKKWHDNIIANAQSRVLKGYKEVHHILPKSLGGSNDKSNLVELTAREHFLVHLLLCKFTVGRAKHKMLYAFNAMSSMRYDKRKYKLHSRTAGVLRKEFYQSLKGRKDSPETRLKKSLRFQGKNNPNYGKKFSVEHKRKLSEAKKGKKHILFGKKHKPETIEKMINKKLGKKHTKETRLKMSKSRLGKTLSKNARKKISEFLKGNKRTLGMICINKDNKTKMIYKNELQNYLNLGFIKGRIKRTQQNLRSN